MTMGSICIKNEFKRKDYGKIKHGIQLFRLKI